MTIHHNGSSYSVSLGRDEFERLTEAQLERTIDKTRVAMKTAEEHGVCPIDKLLLVGGSSRMPAVRARLQKEFGLEGLLYDPDQSIAKGAALVGDLIRKGQYRPNTTGVRTATGDVAALTFVTSKSLGIYVRKYDREEYYVDYLIDRNSPIPTSKTRQYFTVNDNQPYLDVRVMEQRQEPSPVPEENTLVHQRPLQFHIPLPKHSPLDITYAIDSQQLLHIHVKEPKSGQTWEFDVARSGQITDAEIGALKAEFTHASALAT